DVLGEDRGRRGGRVAGRDGGDEARHVDSRGARDRTRRRRIRAAALETAVGLDDGGLVRQRRAQLARQLADDLAHEPSLGAGAAVESGADTDWVAINDVAAPPMLAQLLKYDTVYGPFAGTVEAEDRAIVVDGERIVAPMESDPARLPWGELDVDVVIESTGRFR